MKKVISYSLYGNKPIYLLGAVRNAQEVGKYYPDWGLRFYIGRSVPGHIVKSLTDLNAQLVFESGAEDASAMFWRFQVFSDPEVERAMVRDADSRLSIREAMAVKEWVLSGKDFHIMRDHPAHDCAILGGLWGAKAEALRGISLMIESQVLNGCYGEDQDFLGKYIYPLAHKSSIIHDSYFSRESWAKRFPSPLENLHFVGEVYDEYDIPRKKDREVLLRVLGSRLYRYRLRIGSWWRRVTV